MRNLLSNSSLGESHIQTSREERSVSTSLLMRVRENDQQAWHRFVHLFAPLIWRWCRECGLPPEAAEDISQNVLTRVHARMHTFRREGPRDTFRGWLWTVTRNMIRDHFRTMPDEPQGRGGTDMLRNIHQLPDRLPDDPDLAAGIDTGTGVTHRALELIKSQFEPKTWDAFWRATVEKEKPAEIAAEMGISVAAVYKYKSRVLQRMREEFDGLLN